MGSTQHLQTIDDSHPHSAVTHGTYSQALIDAIKAHVAVIDRDGNIRAVNRAWVAFARANGAADLKSTGIGANYLKMLSNAMDTDPTAGNVYEGILAVLRRRRESFMIEYPCHTPEAQHWFRMEARPLHLEDGGALLVHHDITDLHTVQMERESLIGELSARNKALEEEQTILQQELSLLETQARGHSTDITAHLYGAGPLRRLAPRAFQELIADYGELIPKALEARAYRVQTDLSVPLQAIAERVGSLNGGPRDMIDMHREVISRKLTSVRGVKAQALADEARMMLIKLLCYLAAYYRRFAVGNRQCRVFRAKREERSFT